jgi:hypothetical protein
VTDWAEVMNVWLRDRLGTKSTWEGYITVDQSAATMTRAAAGATRIDTGNIDLCSVIFEFPSAEAQDHPIFPIFHEMIHTFSHYTMYESAVRSIASGRSHKSIGQEMINRYNNSFSNFPLEESVTDSLTRHLLPQFVEDVKREGGVDLSSALKTPGWENHPYVPAVADMNYLFRALDLPKEETLIDLLKTPGDKRVLKIDRWIDEGYMAGKIKHPKSAARSKREKFGAALTSPDPSGADEIVGGWVQSRTPELDYAVMKAAYVGISTDNPDAPMRVRDEHGIARYDPLIVNMPGSLVVPGIAGVKAGLRGEDPDTLKPDIRRARAFEFSGKAPRSKR